VEVRYHKVELVLMADLLLHTVDNSRSRSQGNLYRVEHALLVQRNRLVAKRTNTVWGILDRILVAEEHPCMSLIAPIDPIGFH
jgi:hypothetical protein